MASILPLFSLQQAKAELPTQKWSQIIQTLARTLDSHIQQQPATDTQHTTAFVESYLRNSAFEILNQPSVLIKPKAILSKSESVVRSQILQLANRFKTSLNHAALLDLAIVYQKKEDGPNVKEILDSHSSSFGRVLTEQLVPAFNDILQTSYVAGQATPSAFIQTRLKLVRLINGLIRSQSQVVIASFNLRRDFVLALAQCYQVTLAEVAFSRGGIRVQDQGLSADWQQPWMETKVGIIDIFHPLIDHAIQTASTSSFSESEQALFDVLHSLIDHASMNFSTSAQWFVDTALLVDYEHAYHLSDSLRKAWRRGNQMVDTVISGLEGLNRPLEDSAAAGGLEILLRDLSPLETHKVARKTKGKSKALDQDTVNDSGRDDDIDIAITKVLDLFPDENRQFVQAALRDPSYYNSAEKVITALLEDTLPPNLVALRAGPLFGDDDDTNGTDDDEYERRNVFDNEEIDASRVQIGKNKLASADLLLQDKSFMADMKADILRRVAEHSSDEDDYGASRPSKAYRDVAFEEDLDDAPVEPRIKLSGADGGGFSDEEGGEDVKPADNKLDPEGILLTAYSRDPKLFDRDAATRRSKARTDLRAQTGWADEQIEGWRIMLDRNPRKDKILEKQAMDSSRAPQVAIVQPRDPQDRAGEFGGLNRGQGSRGRGGAPGGRGRGQSAGGSGTGQKTSSDPQTARDRAWKEKNKSRARQRGHDKKVARGGAGGPPIS
ncbi:hypothetical protein FRB94_001515 [Tulasnella sp. JGI-2019a]|nr:hypothetical protein FRB94_001515 [Tulasnella sp. JGI-2019a]